MRTKSFPEPSKKQHDVFHAHGDKRQTQPQHGLFEEHLTKGREIPPGGIVIEKHLHGLQKRRERDPCDEFLNVPGHHFDGPCQTGEHDGKHAQQVRRRHRKVLGNEQIDA